MTDVRIIWMWQRTQTAMCSTLPHTVLPSKRWKTSCVTATAKTPPAGPLGDRLPSGTRHVDAISLWSGNMSMTTR
jgi:hypothetical protein